MSASVISDDSIKKIAHLARLELKPAEFELYSRQLSAILEYVSKLSEVDTKNVAPLVTATEMAQTLAEDNVGKYLEPEKLLENAPDRSGNLFKVPPVL